MKTPRRAPCSCHGHVIAKRLVAGSATTGGTDQSSQRTVERRDGAAHSAEGEADALFVGRIVTMEEGSPRASAVAVRAGRVVGIGAEEDLGHLVGPGTSRLELGSGVLYPGLIEPHMHLWATASIYNWLDCSPLTHESIDEVSSVIAGAAHSARPGAWILGRSYDPSLLTDFPELTRDRLDALAPENPVFVLNASMHFAYVNSRALHLVGLPDDAPDPQGGFFGHDDSGRLNGVLGEMGAILPVLDHVDQISPDELATNIESITLDAARVGVTTMREALTGALLGQNEVGILSELGRRGRLKSRFSLALLDDVASQWPVGSVEPGSGDEMVWIGARKIVTDGSNQGRSGYLHDPYLGTESCGSLDLTPEHLDERIAWCEENGWQLMVHANGDAATELVADAFHRVLAPRRRNDLRHRVEHCSLVDDGVFEKMAAVGVTPSFLINHVYYWGHTFCDNLLGAERARHLDRLASAVKAGLRFSLHSDYNVSPIDPLHYVAVAATRSMRGGGTLNESESVSVYQALRAVTIDAAWQIHADQVTGSIAPGKYADFVLLDRDPQEVALDELDDVTVVGTWLGGQSTYQAELEHAGHR